MSAAVAGEQLFEQSKVDAWISLFRRW